MRKGRYKRARRVDRKKVEGIIVELAKKGIPPSQIGLILRDKYRVYIKKDLRTKITKILEKHNLQPEIPEDLMNLLKRAVNLHEHLQKNKKDKHSRRGLELLESKIRSLSKYYIKKGKLPKNWKYTYETARLLIQK